MPQEVIVNGVTYRAVSVASIVYSVPATHAEKSGALIDHGANGGIAGADVHIIAKTGQQVDIQGINNHHITNIPIVITGGVVNTQNGGSDCNHAPVCICWKW